MKPHISAKITAILTLLCVSLAAYCSYPTVRNFTRAQLGAGSQTWAIVQDSVGRMLFANKNGLLIYNGVTRELTPIINGSTIRSLKLVYGDTTKLYVGASNEIGYFIADPDLNKMVYRSLLPLVPEEYRNFKEVWNIHRSGDVLWFQADNTILRYDGSTIRAISSENKITTSALINDRLYIATIQDGVQELRDNTFISMPDTEAVKGSKVSAILSFRGGMLIVTEQNGLFQTSSEGIRRFETRIDDFLRDNQVFCAAHKDGKLAFGTVSCGLVLLDLSSGEMQFANLDTGLQNNTVLSLYFDNNDNLWLGLDNGIDYVLTDAPYKNLLGSSTKYGAGYSSLLHNGTLYLGTNQGLYQTKFPMTEKPKPADSDRIIKGQIWELADAGSQVFVCCDAGLAVGSGTHFSFIPDIPGAWDIHLLRNDKQHAIVSTYDKFYLLESVFGKWVNRGVIEGYDDIGGHFTEDKYGNIWLAHWLKGVYCLHLDVAAQRFDAVKFFNNESGLPSNHNNGVVLLGDKVTITSEYGLYELSPDALTMQRDEKLNALLNSPAAARLHIAPDNDIWAVSQGKICVAGYNLSGRRTIDSVSYSPIYDNLIPGFENFNFVNNDRLIISCQDGFYDLNLNRHKSFPNHCQTYLSRVSANGDSTIYISDFQRKDISIEVSYDLNSLLFEFCMPEYRTENAVQYSFFLEGYDSDPSRFSTSASKEYTRLNVGTYTLKVRTYNTYTQQTDEQSYTITVLPPWYRTKTAWIIYSCVLLVIIWLVWLLIRKMAQNASQRAAARKELEMKAIVRHAEEEALRKDVEISTLKSRQLEQEIKQKSEELSNTTMNVVRKNEILRDIADKLDALRQSEAFRSAGNDAAKQIAKIKTLIKDNISHDNDWRTFTRNFDIVYEDFTRHLTELHPDLTTTEIKICCYLKMGLSSKEIAPLFNISYRSVEMTRYRLRKKLRLPREANLTDYLTHL